MFSARTAWDRTVNPFARALAVARASGDIILNLTESNPTRAGLVDQAPLIATLGDARGAHYEPAPLGHPTARQAVARYYGERGMHVDPEHVVISASTSESYGWLLRLLADEGDTVLVPQPSYPLFSWLAAAESVRLAPYRLLADAGWAVDTGEIQRVVDAEPRARAILAVHPNNPTGVFTRRADAAGNSRRWRRSAVWGWWWTRSSATTRSASSPPIASRASWPLRRPPLRQGRKSRSHS